MPAGATRPAWVAAATELADGHDLLAGMYERHGAPRPRPGAAPSDRFQALSRAIAYQQLAGRAAEAIWGRALAAVSPPFTPEAVLDTGPEPLRAAGLSGAKTAALLDLATKVHDRTVRLDQVARWSDQVVIDHLTVVRGIGPWTAQMFLMFDLRRLDVWPTGDLGVRVGLGRAMGRDEPPSEREMVDLGEPFAPYRSVVAWWCWQEADTVTPSA